MTHKPPETPDLNRVKGLYRVVVLTPDDLPAVLKARDNGNARAAIVLALVAAALDRFNAAENCGGVAACAGCDSDLDNVGAIGAVVAALPEPGAGIPVALGVCHACAKRGALALLQHLWPGIRPIYHGKGHA